MAQADRQRWEETAAAVAHELGTPLTVAQAAVDAIVGASADDHLSELARTAARSLRSMELQVGRLRHLEGASDDRLVLQRVELVGLIRELVDDLDASLLHDHPTRVAAPDRLDLAVDANQIRQVLYNLLSNAAKYSPSGREIVVSLDRDAGQVVIQVRDRGEGVAPDDGDRIFGKYERGASEIPGAGLGLFLSRLIVEAHDGSLRLVPAEGEGSIFEIRLPDESVDRSPPGASAER